MKLNAEQKSQVLDLLEHPGWRVMEGLIGYAVADIEHAVLRISLTAGAENELAYAKARAEGAKRLQIQLIALLNSLRKKSAKVQK